MEVKKTRDLRLISTQRLMFVALRGTNATSSVQPSIFDMSDRRLIEKNPASYQNCSLTSPVPSLFPDAVCDIGNSPFRLSDLCSRVHQACGPRGGLASIEPSCKATTAQ